MLIEQSNKCEEYREKLKQFTQLTDPEIQSITNGNKFFKQPAPEEQETLFKGLNQFLQNLANCGEFQPLEWKDIKNLIIIGVKNVLIMMQEKFGDCKTQQGESFEDQVDIILQFLCGFEEKAPFTIQRIAELIVDPQKQYKSSKKILFAFEKLVNISPL